MYYVYNLYNLYNIYLFAPSFKINWFKFWSVVYLLLANEIGKVQKLPKVKKHLIFFFSYILIVILLYKASGCPRISAV